MAKMKHCGWVAQIREVSTRRGKSWKPWEPVAFGTRQKTTQHQYVRFRIKQRKARARCVRVYTADEVAKMVREMIRVCKNRVGIGPMTLAQIAREHGIDTKGE